MKHDWTLWASGSSFSTVSESLFEDEIAELVQLIIGSLRSNKVQIRQYTAPAPALTMRWQTDIDSIRRRLKNYSQLQTTLPTPFFPPPLASFPSSLPVLFSLPFSVTLSTDPSFLLGAVISVETFPQLCKPFESSKYLETRCTVSNLSPLIVVVVLSKSVNCENRGKSNVETTALGSARFNSRVLCGLPSWCILFRSTIPFVRNGSGFKSPKCFENLVINFIVLSSEFFLPLNITIVLNLNRHLVCRLNDNLFYFNYIILYMLNCVSSLSFQILINLQTHVCARNIVSRYTSKNILVINRTNSIYF